MTTMIIMIVMVIMINYCDDDKNDNGAMLWLMIRTSGDDDTKWDHGKDDDNIDILHAFSLSDWLVL